MNNHVFNLLNGCILLNKGVPRSKFNTVDKGFPPERLQSS